MDLTLQTDEATLVRRVLANYLSDLRAEVYKTENYELRQELKADEAVIKSIIERLDRAGIGVS
jgi:hypothetical protein